MAEIRVGRWDCFVCGHVGNLGPETHCKNCGASRPRDVVFYLPDEAEVVKDKKILAEAKGGADWVCSYCSSSNKAAFNVCQTCGNDREVDEEKELETRDLSLNELPTTGARGVNRVKEQQPKEKRDLGKSGNFWRYILGATGLGGVFWWLFSFSTPIDVPVTSMYWEREIEVLEYKQVQEEEFNLPSEATQVESFKAIHHYDRVVTGYETRTRTKQVKVGEREYVCGQRDKGNGYFEEIKCKEPIYETRTEEYEAPVYREVPVYKTKYRYLIYRWKNIAPLVASGTTNKANWPTILPKMKANPKRFKTGDEREYYRFSIETHKGEIVEYEAKSYETFKELEVGEQIKAEKSTIFGTFKGLKNEY